MVFYFIYKIRCFRLCKGRSAVLMHPFMTMGWNQPLYIHSLQEEAEGIDGAYSLKTKKANWYIIPHEVKRKVRPDVSSQVKDQNLCHHSLVNTQRHCTFSVMSLTNSNSQGSRTQPSVWEIPARKSGRMKEVVVVGGLLYAEQQVW